MVFSGGIVLRLFRVVISRTWFGGDSVPLVEILMVKITKYLGEITVFCISCTSIADVLWFPCIFASTDFSSKGGKLP